MRDKFFLYLSLPLFVVAATAFALALIIFLSGMIPLYAGYKVYMLGMDFTDWLLRTDTSQQRSLPRFGVPFHE